MGRGGSNLFRELRRFVYSMADPRRDMAHDIRKHSGPLITHLLFLIYFRDNQAYSHWRSEAFGFVPHNVARFKGSLKFPDQGFLDQALFRWLIDSDPAIRKNFCFKVMKEGLLFPGNFESDYRRSVARVEGILHEVTGVLAGEQAIDADQFSAILEKYGL